MSYSASKSNEDGEMERSRYGLLQHLAIALLAIWLLPGAATAKETITWGYSHSPPNRFAEGSYRGQGLHDQVRHFLQQQLSAYDHKEVVAPFARSMEEIKSGHPWCYLNATKNAEREKWAYFSLPALINLPYRVIIRKDEQARFDQFGALSLKTLLADRKLRTSLYRGATYGPIIDPLLQQRPPEQRHADTDQAIRMLLNDRIDYLIEFSITAFYLAKEQGQPGALLALPFKESGEPDITRVMCPNNAWGKKVIDQIDALLRVERPKLAYRKQLETWQGEEGTREIRRLYDDVFLRME